MVMRFDQLNGWQLLAIQAGTLALVTPLLWGLGAMFRRSRVARALTVLLAPAIGGLAAFGLLRAAEVDIASYLFATCRFAHYLKCIVRDKVGSFKEAEEMQRWLQSWIIQYVDGDPAHSSEETKARKPLAAAEVVVEADQENPGYYSSKFFLRPHYQLEGLTVSLRLVSKLPSQKGA